MPKQEHAKNSDPSVALPLFFFACPNSDCAGSNCFDGGKKSNGDLIRVPCL